MRALLAAPALICGFADPAAAAMTLTSHDLTPGAAMPAQHIYPRCGGQNVSPELAWSSPPPAAKSLVLTMIDLDVKPALWSHWVVVDLPTTAHGLARGAAALPVAAHAVASNFGDLVYAGPCPPPGTGVHHYEITVWAMPTATVEVAPDANARALRTQLEKQSIEHASLNTVVASK